MGTTDKIRPAVRASRDRKRAPRSEHARALPRPNAQAGKPPVDLLPDAIPFQGDLDEIIEEQAPKLVRSMQYTLISLLLALVLISALVNVDVVVTGTGQLTTDSPPIILQPIGTSIIRELNVKMGDVVKRGQVIARLDPTFAQADLNSLSAQHRTLVAKADRLQAELDSAPYVEKDPYDPDESLQATLYEQRQAEYASRLTLFDQEIRRYRSTIESAETDRKLLERQLDVAKQVEQMRASLLERQTGSKLQYLDAETMRMRTQRDFVSAENRLTEAHHFLESKQTERQAFIEDWRRALLEELVAVRTDAAKIGEGVTKATRLHDLVEVVAPADGIVLEVAIRSAGSVMREAEPLVSIVPAGAKLIADIRIKSSDVGYTKQGDDVVVKVDAFPYQRHGLLHGRLRSISEESFVTKDQSTPNTDLKGGHGAFHRGQIELTSLKLSHLQEGSHLIPGMTVTADIKVGSRSILSYFLYPITRGFDEIIREP